jgi:hypothetical protein
VLEALYCSALRVPVVGLLQARRERERGSQVPGVVAGEREHGATGLVLCCVVFVVVSLVRPSPEAGGFVLLL